MIIQGSDKPIIIEGNQEISEANVICAELFHGNDRVKKWGREDILFGTKGEIALPLAQDETFAMPAGKATLEIKWRGKSYIECAEKIIIHIIERNSKEVI